MVTHGAGSSTRAQAELPRNLARVLDLFRTMLSVTAAIVTEERQQQEGQSVTTEASASFDDTDAEDTTDSHRRGLGGAGEHHGHGRGAAADLSRGPSTEAELQVVFVTKRVLETRTGKFHARKTCHCLKSAKHPAEGIAVNKLPAGLAECAVCFEK